MRSPYAAAGPLALIAAFLTSTVLLTACPVQAEEAKKAGETISVLGKAEMKVPAEFKRAERASRIIEHEFKVGEGETTARLTMMAAGGSVDANIKRWKGQFSGGDDAAQKTEQMDIGKWSVHIVDVSGAYAERMGGGPFAGGKVVQRENYAMTGAIMVEPEGRQYFVKMIGPAEIVKGNREKFVAMVKSIGK
ncbi:hypothetical protein [Stieleria mannarensis]|uniref:hypothetical protein n=1 Tax=Stieleria mannarensis TaxID=2755585 RepID=UPI0025708261|nr:hypothetical protein [Rhodopirellula sp. JC639]